MTYANLTYFIEHHAAAVIQPLETEELDDIKLLRTQNTQGLQEQGADFYNPPRNKYVTLTESTHTNSNKTILCMLVAITEAPTEARI